jgi:phosphatidylinositol alpha-1,6-mannosyltransferase
MPLLVTDTHYVIAGSGPELEAVGAAALEAGVSERVHVLGFVADEALKQLLRGSDLFLMPNIPVAGDMEGFGVVLMEAALSELYTVASALEGIRDAVSQPESGILVEPRNAAAFADAINKLASDPDRLRQLGRSAGDHVGRTFSWAHAVERYVKVLSDVVARKASA